MIGFFIDNFRLITTHNEVETPMATADSGIRM
jgi:hypothetical protein